MSVHWGGVDEVVVVVGDACSSAREGEKLGPKKTENRACQLGFGCALSNRDVGRWRGVLGWCGQGGGGGGVCAFEYAPGGEAGAIKKRKPSSPARFRVRPVKQRCRAMVGGGGVVWTRW